MLDLNTLLVTHRVRNDFRKHDGWGNILHGAFTTGWARLQLYEKGLQKKVAMFCISTQTQSCTYRDPVKIRYLWKLKSVNLRTIEPAKFGEEPDAPMRERYCLAFVSGGPKNYCLKLSFKNKDGSIPKPEDREVSDFKTVIRGFSLSKKAKETLNFQTMQKIVEDLAVWAAASPEELEELVETFKCRPSASGIVNIDPPSIKRFTIRVGDRRPPQGVKRSRRCLESDNIDQFYDPDEVERSASKRFCLRPNVLKRQYSAVITKRVPDLLGEISLNYLFPFGYKV